MDRGDQLDESNTAAQGSLPNSNDKPWRLEDVLKGLGASRPITRRNGIGDQENMEMEQGDLKESNENMDMDTSPSTPPSQPPIPPKTYYHKTKALRGSPISDTDETSSYDKILDDSMNLRHPTPLTESEDEELQVDEEVAQDGNKQDEQPNLEN